jgi:hypothetical protein
MVILGKTLYLCFDCLGCRAAQLRLRDVGLPVKLDGKGYNIAFFEQQRISSACVVLNELNASVSQEHLVGIWKNHFPNLAAQSDQALLKHFAKAVPLHIPLLDDSKEFRVRLVILNEVRLWKGKALRADLVVAVLPEIAVQKLEYLARYQQDDMLFKKHPLPETLAYRPVRYAHAGASVNIFDYAVYFCHGEVQSGNGSEQDPPSHPEDCDSYDVGSLVNSWGKYVKQCQGVHLHHLQNLIWKLESSVPNVCYLRRQRDEEHVEKTRWEAFAKWVRARVESGSTLKHEPDKGLNPFLYVRMAE